MALIRQTKTPSDCAVSPELRVPGGDGGGHSAAGHSLPSGAGQDPVADQCSGDDHHYHYYHHHDDARCTEAPGTVSPTP